MIKVMIAERIHLIPVFLEVLQAEDPNLNKNKNKSIKITVQTVRGIVK